MSIAHASDLKRSKLMPSRLAATIVHSEIRNMSVECDRRGGINMSQGICDLELPEPVRLAAQRAIETSENHYTRYDGTDALRRALAEKAARENGIHVDPDTEVVVSGGSTGAFYSACLALLNPGDEVILFEPAYGYHATTIKAIGGVPRFVPTTPPDWGFTAAALEGAVKPRTRAIMIGTPANPSGKVYTPEELELLARFAVAHDLFVFTDEIYEYFVYDGRTHISPGSIDLIADRTITISGYSKTFSITGWRIGYALCRAPWARLIGYVSDLVYVCAPAPLQAGVAAGIRSLDAHYYRTLRDIYCSKRDRFCQVLDKVGLAPYVPQGAYYVLADASRLPGDTSREKAMYLLEKTGVATVPGSAFYTSGGGETLLRFCFAKRDDVLNEACQRLQCL